MIVISLLSCVQPGVKRKYREAVQDLDLSKGTCLKSIKWSKWCKAIVPSSPYHKPRGKDKHLFIPRSTGYRLNYNRSNIRRGLRHSTIIKTFTKRSPAIYEFAVQPVISRKKYVVCFKSCISWSNRRPGSWEKYLLGKFSDQINEVMKCGVTIWMRQGLAKDQASLRQATAHINKNYDYAWIPRKSAKGTSNNARKLKRGNIIISGN